MTLPPPKLAEPTAADGRDGGGQCGLAVVDVTDGADVDVGLRANEIFLGHDEVLLKIFPKRLKKSVISKKNRFRRRGKPTPRNVPMGKALRIPSPGRCFRDLLTHATNSDLLQNMELLSRFELETSSLPRKCSTY